MAFCNGRVLRREVLRLFNLHGYILARGIFELEHQLFRTAAAYVPLTAIMRPSRPIIQWLTSILGEPNRTGDRIRSTWAMPGEFVRSALFKDATRLVALAGSLLDGRAIKTLELLDS